MSRNCLRKFRLAKCPPRIHMSSRSGNCRDFYASSHRNFALVASALEFPEPGNSSQDRRDTIAQQKLENLKQVLGRKRRSPGRAWATYVDVLNVIPLKQVPLEIHQEVLRHCTRPAQETREEHATRVFGGDTPKFSHIHEVRFQAVIHNMRQAGHTPSLEDYHFILSQFAAVGHHLGAVQVMDEITHLGLEKTPKTYGLCLQALCHRLTLPIWHEYRPLLVTDVTKICLKWLNEMWALKIPLTSLNFDLAIRVLKETLDYEGFERLMKVAYGIDLAYPDRPPLEFWSAGRKEDSMVEDLIAKLPEPLPFSTAALSTTIDMLGRLGNVSKMVQVFEVLTTPLPQNAVTTPASSFEDDEDDDYGVNRPEVASYTAPHVEPNTTTYHLLLKWLSRAGHAVLVRHYLLQAIAHDHDTDRRLRGDCLRYHPSEILAPHFSLNRGIILPVFAEANRDKNMELLRWVQEKIGQILWRKRRNLVFYNQTAEDWRSSGLLDPLKTSSDENADSKEASVSTPENSHHAAIPAGQTVEPTAAHRGHIPEESSPTVELPPMPHFEVDLDAPPEPAPPPKIFDIKLHTSILRHDINSLEELQKHIAFVVGRNTQRVKERLGRRVWEDKDVYLRTENRRARINRDTWRETVKYHPDRVVPAGYVPPRRESAPHLRPGWLASRRGLMTAASSCPAHICTSHPVGSG